MGEITLSEGLRIGHPRIDDQHELLLEVLRDLKGLIAAEAAIADSAKRLCEFIRLMEEHFVDEEKLLRELRYGAEEVDAHALHHREVIGTLQSLAADCTAVEGYTLSLVEELLRLFFNEVIAADMKIKTHLQKIGFRSE